MEGGYLHRLFTSLLIASSNDGEKRNDAVVKRQKGKIAVVIDAGGRNISKLTRQPCIRPDKVEKNESGAPNHSDWARQ